MTEEKKFLVGFDRFISFQWAEFTLDLATHSPAHKEVQIQELKRYLSVFLKGHDSTRKTANVLTRLWLESYSDLDEYRTAGIELYHLTAAPEHVALHWGMSLAIFPLFRDIAFQIGKLTKLQGYFRRQEIHSRIMEKYSNLNTLPRSIDRIIQSMQSWGVIQQQVNGSFQFVEIKSENINLQQWLIGIAVCATPHKRILLNDLYRLPELFPFVINTETTFQIPRMTRLERDGNNLEYLVAK